MERSAIRMARKEAESGERCWTMSSPSIVRSPSSCFTKSCDDSSPTSSLYTASQELAVCAFPHLSSLSLCACLNLSLSPLLYGQSNGPTVTPPLTKIVRIGCLVITSRLGNAIFFMSLCSICFFVCVPVLLLLSFSFITLRL